MESLIPFKDEGIQKMSDNNFEQAILSFNNVIEKLDPKTNEEAVLYMVCLLNRSACYIQLNKFEEGVNDANEVIKLYQRLRPEETQLKMDQKAIETDPLTVPLSNAYVRKGQADELQGKMLDALHNYAAASSLKMDGDGQIGMKSVLQRLGVPEINQADPQLQQFSMILVHLLSDVNILIALNNMLQFLLEGDVKEEQIVKYNDTGCCRILYAVIQLYMDNEVIVTTAITTLRVLAEKGAQDPFNGFLVMRVAADHWKASKNVVSDIIRFLAGAPIELFPYLARADFIPVCIDALDFDLENSDFDNIFYVLFHLSFGQEQLVQIGAEGAVEKALSIKTKASLLFLSKAALLVDNMRVIEREEGSSWALSEAEKNQEDKHVVAAAAVILSQLFVLASVDETAVPKDELKQKATKVYELFFPLATKYSKDSDVISPIFSALAACAEFNIEFIKEKRVIQAASAILTMHLDDEPCVVNIVSLLYMCCVNGLLEEIKTVRSAVPTVVSTLKDHADNLQLVERAVAIIVECDHPSKKKLFEAAIKQQPESPILAKYKNQFQQ
ncbi:hypothetical protein TVAG_423170 [Trichomonas vaginalis G3]|uniref:TPR Domain containing protein n=1 Tax=Trichomonas vaginalis (strain ATCC PRA-98 / G3) TaxID=412133 RepID=A2DTF5_TRIV3|nr:HSP70-HSP90 organizing protein 1-related family [Trichomonas vaginalis G3]EAY16264.1 hypothetical protein TVAG_423170 [Trichomonas vaginalis G3]KAI5523414.1 HSP70-HSP90 organizing protein 1-related family [Trichomonas vaginalis G3]|eukprot:XP_001328487.1 hypothetical protein [Trichomonas vaginalis G3]